MFIRCIEAMMWHETKRKEKKTNSICLHKKTVELYKNTSSIKRGANLKIFIITEHYIEHSKTFVTSTQLCDAKKLPTD